jgi:hypothetical protein
LPIPPEGSLVFVVGSRRSGTTLLYNILCSDPQSNPHVYEIQPLTRLLEALQWSRDNYELTTRYFFTTPDDFAGFGREICTRFLEHAWRAAGTPRHLVFKNPELSQHVQALATGFPHARIVACVRDPRDQMVSEMDALRRSVEAGAIPALVPFESAVGWYGAYLRPVVELEARDPDRVRFVRYEELVTKTRETLAGLSQFTGLDLSGYSPDRDWKRMELPLAVLQSRPNRSDLYGRPITDARVGVYRHRLTPDEIRLVETANAALMTRFGYTPATV